MAEQDTERKDGVETTVSADETRKGLSEFLGRAGFGNERFVVTQYGKETAALIGMRDLQRLRDLDGAA
ncbi:MAG: Antitoxin Phd YefM, type toxin-antitoxin system [Gemmatimonadetes bacterium]|nr:Antitoxin Phd YefM, type toxin-antitoxin system [Gemmatimonadota bacterium]